MVLCRPELPENIGAVARTCRCYGLGPLRLVGAGAAEKVASPAFRATARLAPGEDPDVRTYPDLAAAVADCSQSLGFTRRQRRPDEPLHALPSLAAQWDAREAAPAAEPEAIPQPWAGTALVFGPESSGLTAEDSPFITHWLSIPYPDPVLSLNLSHAVAIVLYALASTGANVENGSGKGDAEPASLGDSSAALQDWLAAWDRTGALDRGGKRTARIQSLEKLWKRMRPTPRELEFLSGMLQDLARGRAPGRSGPEGAAPQAGPGQTESRHVEPQPAEPQP